MGYRRFAGNANWLFAVKTAIRNSPSPQETWMIHGVYTGGALLLSPQGLLLRGELLGEDLVVLPTDGDEEAFLVQITTAVAPSLDQVMHLGCRRGAPGAVDDNAAPVPVPFENLLANHRLHLISNQIQTLHLDQNYHRNLRQLDF